MQVGNRIAPIAPGPLDAFRGRRRYPNIQSEPPNLLSEPPTFPVVNFYQKRGLWDSVGKVGVSPPNKSF